ATTVSTYAVHVGQPGQGRVEHVVDGTPEPVRETWDDTNRWYPTLLAQGGRVERSHDLRLAHVVLRRSRLVAGTALARAAAGPWDALEPVPAGPDPLAHPRPVGLFELSPSGGSAAAPALDVVAELRAQLAAVAGAEGPDGPGRLRTLLAAESAGALVAAEMHHAGVPWRADVHDRILRDALRPRPRPGERPARTEEVAASGGSGLETWVRDGRFRTECVVGGVVAGRWASSGGGALQLARQVRRAVVADGGWRLVVADAAQLEPRVLAGLAHDERMAAAGRGGDLYAGIVASGAVATREHAKVGMLGAMYGGTTGDSAVVLPRLARAFPDAIGLVERAAQAGERGEVVT